MYQWKPDGELADADLDVQGAMTRRRGAVAIAGRPEASGSRTAQGLGAIRHRDVLDWGTGELREQNGRGSGREGHPPGIYGTMAAQAIVTRHGPLVLAQGGSGVCEGIQVGEFKEEDEADGGDDFRWNNRENGSLSMATLPWSAAAKYVRAWLLRWGSNEYHVV